MRSLEVERGYLSSVQAATTTTATTTATTAATTATTSTLPLSPTPTTPTLSTNTPTSSTPTSSSSTTTSTVHENPAVDLFHLLYLLRKDLNTNAQCTIRIGELLFVCCL